MKKTKEYDRTRQKQWSWRKGLSQHGRSYIYITCPFCSTEVRAFTWSLAGSGKLCPTCGAIHVLHGFTLPVKFEIRVSLFRAKTTGNYYDNSNLCGECTGAGCVRCYDQRGLLEIGTVCFPLSSTVSDCKPPAIAYYSAWRDYGITFGIKGYTPPKFRNNGK